jgi:hypothetical protein
MYNFDTSFTRRWKIWKHFVNYFPISLVKTAELDPSHSYLGSIL